MKKREENAEKYLFKVITKYRHGAYLASHLTWIENNPYYNYKDGLLGSYVLRSLCTTLKFALDFW